MAGNPISGRKAAMTTKQRYGEGAFQKWGAEGNKKRINPKPLFKDKAAASKAGTTGGKRGKRHRNITLGSKLTAGEWGILLKLSNRAAGQLRLRGEIDVIEQHNVYHHVMDAWEHGAWLDAIINVLKHPLYIESLGKTIEEECLIYEKKVEGQPRHSYDREYYSELRNVRAAFSLAKEYYKNTRGGKNES